ncbi:MAG: DUF4402 domain-containing protein [Sphingomicrobium sp.]
MRNRRPIGPVCGLLFVLGLASAGPAGAETQVAQVNANVVKPLTLKWIQNLDLGTIILGPGSWSGATIALSRTGALTCSNANVTCTGATSVAKYNVTGSNNMTVRISAPNVTLINQSDSTRTLTLVTDSPGSVVLTSSGAPGITFPLGGSIIVQSTTVGGVYRGTFNVTVDY